MANKETFSVDEKHLNVISFTSKNERYSFLYGMEVNIKVFIPYRMVVKEGHNELSNEKVIFICLFAFGIFCYSYCSMGGKSP